MKRPFSPPTFQRCKPLRILLALVAMLCTASGSQMAHANGFRVGPGRLHAKVDVSARYDSTVATSESGQFYGDLILIARPGLELDLPLSIVDIQLNGALAYHWYLGLVDASSKEVSHVEGNAQLSLKFNPEAPLSFEIGDSLRRSDNVTVPTLQLGALSFYNDAYLQLNWRPARGTFTLSPNYHLVSEVFSANGAAETAQCAEGYVCDPRLIGEANYLNHAFSLDSRWNFLPKSAMTLGVSYLMRQYLGSVGTDVNGLTANLGVLSTLLPRLFASLQFGWAHDFAQGAYSSPVARAEFAYRFAEKSQVTVGYRRSFTPTASPTWVAYSIDRAYLSGNVLLLGRLNLKADVSADFIKLRGTEGANPFSTTQVTGSFDVTYAILAWLSASAGYRVNYYSSFAGYSDFVRHEPNLKIALYY